jgi:hypothetical protein
MIRKTKRNEKDLYQVMVILNKEDIEVRQYLANTLEEAQDIIKREEEDIIKDYKVDKGYVNSGTYQTYIQISRNSNALLQISTINVDTDNIQIFDLKKIK